MFLTYSWSPFQDTVLQAPPGYVTPNWPGLYTPTWSVRRSNGNGTDVLPGNYLFEAIGESTLRFELEVIQLIQYPIDIWQYTLYWHLVFHALIFGLPALWFTLVLLFSPTSSLSLRVRSRKNLGDTQSIEMTSMQNEKPEQQFAEAGSSAGRPDKKAAQGGVVGITSTGETIQLSSVQTTAPESSLGSGTGELAEALSLTSSTPSATHKSGARPRKSAPLYLAFLPFVFLLLWGVASALIMSTIIGFVLAAVYNTTGFEMAT